MKSVSTFARGLLGAAICLTPVAFSADTVKPDEKKAEGTAPATVESRIAALEKRIQDLERQLEERDAPRRGQRFQRPMRETGRDMDEMWNRFRRELEQGFGEMPDMRFGPPGGMMPQQRPRLGVQMAEIQPEFVERFKNDVKEGVFIMSVVPGSPAEKAGIMVGDAVTSFAGKKITSPDDLMNAVKSAP
jgi:C-terminal processing protease CtpA/Prc